MRRAGEMRHYYRAEAADRRHIRPWPDRRIDVLGKGYVVAPPSKSTRGQYAFIEGGLNDLDRLPCMRNFEKPSDHRFQDEGATFEGTADEIDIPQGVRNKGLWRHCMRQARYCDDLDGLLDVAMTFNDQHCIPPLGAGEVIRTAKSALAYQKKDENWFGTRGMIS